MTTPTPTTPRVLVTGASGTVGASVVEQLLARGVDVRAGGRDLASLTEQAPQAEAVRLDFTDPTTFGPTLNGVGRVFLIRPPGGRSRRLHRCRLRGGRSHADASCARIGPGARAVHR